MRLTQGAFSFLPDLTDAQISSQIEYCLGNGWAVSIEYTDDPHPRNTYWEMFGQPMFDIRDAAGIMGELQSCRRTFPQAYIKIAPRASDIDGPPSWTRSPLDNLRIWISTLRTVSPTSVRCWMSWNGS
jgi:hypothetical protein